ncbi:hypothetical protein CMO91_05975 [Candidatus Woesearchaeota archaeon]|nr:hypothetical protein [Candidatus Woesearchaeota archaeon]|tara:strand:+ start:598 stop:957 length:360 start_codon:yes stop_codon:yes gene_type:complete
MNLRPYAPVVVRVGVSLVFIWFGINQLLSPETFLGYVPVMLDAYAETLLLVNGIAELVLGIILLSGFLTRPAALLLALHLAGITVSLGYNEIAVRDFGLVLATLSVFLHGKDNWGSTSQ